MKKCYTGHYHVSLPLLLCMILTGAFVQGMALPHLSAPVPVSRTHHYFTKKVSFFALDTVSPSEICDTSAFRIIYGVNGIHQLTDVKSLANDKAVCAGQIRPSGKPDNDAWLLKTDQFGNIIWTKAYGGDQNDYFRKVLPTKDGGLLAIGSVQNTNPDAPTGYAWAIKTDAKGNVKWSYRMNILYSVMQQAWQTADGGFALVASITLRGSVTKIVVLKITATGNLQWMKAYSSGSTDYGYYIKQSNDGNLLVSGFVYQLGAGLHDGFLMKVSGKDGTFLWMKTYGSPGDDVIDCFDENSQGELFLSLNWGGDKQASIVKTNADGKVLWTRLYETPFASSRAGTLKFTRDKGIVLSLSDATTHTGGAVLKVDNQGTPQWAYDYHPSESDQYSQNSVDELKSDRGFFICGYANGASGQNSEGYLAKTDKNGKAGTCQIKTIKVVARDISPIVQDQHWSEVTSLDGWESIAINTSAPAITRRLVCPECCISSNTTVDTSVCEGQTYLLPDNTRVSKAGTYTVKFTSATGCDSIITTHLTINPSYHQIVYDSICVHQHYTLPSGKIVDTTGSYVSSFLTQKGCDSIITTKLSYRSILYIQYQDSICEGTTLKLPNGKIVNQAGTFRMILPSTTSCDTLATYNVFIKHPPSITLGADTCLIAGQKLLLDPGEGYPHYEWQNGSSGATQEVSFPGTYWVKATNECGTGADTLKVTSDCLPIIFVPNAFTPNGDGMNDVFRILNIHGQKLIVFNIYDRWGKRVFHTTNITRGWDGKYKGVLQNMGSYVYLIRLINLSEKPKTYHGSVLLIR